MAAELDVTAGMSLDSVLNTSRYDSEQACMEALIAMKWPNGFVCPRCAHTACYRITSRRIPLFECSCCAHQASPLVDTIFENTRLPLVKWFQALQLFLLPNGISATKLSATICVTYKAAWQMLHRIRHAIGEFDAGELLSGKVKISNDKYGRSPFRYQMVEPHVSAVVAGCTVDAADNPEHVKIRLVPHTRGAGTYASRSDIADFINSHVDTDASEIETSSQPYRKISQQYRPLREIVSEARASLANTYVSLGLKHLQAYLNEYTGRYRLRLSREMELMQRQLLHMCVNTRPLPYYRLIMRRPDQPIAMAA